VAPQYVAMGYIRTHAPQQTIGLFGELAELADFVITVMVPPCDCVTISWLGTFPPFCYNLARFG
jgi:hypothetical protein